MLFPNEFRERPVLRVNILTWSMVRHFATRSAE